jgi:hypothetical protein
MTVGKVYFVKIGMMRIAFINDTYGVRREQVMGRFAGIILHKPSY